MLLVHLAGAEQAAAADNWLAGFRDVPASIAQEVNYAARRAGSPASRRQPSGRTRPSPPTPGAPSCCDAGVFRQAGDFTIADAAGFAQRIGLFPIAYTGTLTQGDLFEMAADALSFSYRDGSATVIGRLVSQGTVLPGRGQRPGPADPRPHRPAGGGPLRGRRVPSGHL